MILKLLSSFILYYSSIERLFKMSKDQKEIIEELNKTIDNQQQQIVDLQIQLEKSKNNSGRKSQVLELLRNNKSISILDISNELSISTKNVSSQLTYLRSDGYQIYTDPNGRKLLQE